MWRLTLRIRRLLDSYDNVHFLNNETFIFPPDQGGEIVILGTTLWSLIPDEYSSIIHGELNDYSRIWEGSLLEGDDIKNSYGEDFALLHPQTVNQLHEIQREWLHYTRHRLNASSALLWFDC
jgi:hypothetical protein